MPGPLDRDGQSSSRPSTELRESFDVRFWKTRIYKGRRGQTYAVRWTVEGNEHHETYQTKAHASARFAELRTYARQGVAFSVTTGLPVQEIRNAEAGTTDENQVSWYQHTLNYLARRREGLSGNSLRSIAETLTTVTIKLLTPGPRQPTDVLLRETLYGWAYRNRSEPPAELVSVLDWIAAHSRPLADLADTDLVLDVLEALARKLDGKRAAANTIARKRAALSNVLDYGIGRGLDTNLLPIAAKMWNQPKTTEGIVDPRVVVNRRQAEALLTAVSYQGRVGPRLIAFFACLYYAGLRPSEAVELREDLNIDLPEDDGWGTLYLHRSAPTVGTGWSRSGRRRDPRETQAPGQRHRPPRSLLPRPGALLALAPGRVRHRPRRPTVPRLPRRGSL